MKFRDLLNEKLSAQDKVRKLLTKFKQNKKNTDVEYSYPSGRDKHIKLKLDKEVTLNTKNDEFVDFAVTKESKSMELFSALTKETDVFLGVNGSGVIYFQPDGKFPFQREFDELMDSLSYEGFKG